LNVYAIKAQKSIAQKYLATPCERLFSLTHAQEGFSGTCYLSKLVCLSSWL